MIISIEGEEATGKTTLAYTQPTPIVGFQLDLGADRAIFGGMYDNYFAGKKIQIVPFQADKEPVTWKGHDITVYELPAPVQLEGMRLFGCKELWSASIKLYAAALTDPTVASIVIDTMTLARRLRADAYLQELQEAALKANKPIREKLLQIEYGRPNDSIRDVYTAGAGSRKNLAAVHHLTDERADRPTGKQGEIQNVATGNRILEGLGHTYRFVDVAVRCIKNGSAGITAEVKKCGYSLTLEGTRIDDPTWEKIVGMIRLAAGDRVRI